MKEAMEETRKCHNIKSGINENRRTKNKEEGK
jgi:hypothetical protein